ncbi:MAG: EcsC family protein [Cytobacillus gottheilii]|uniref:EcsC family protein n=1 Tax=Cytobacillus gottheilii TaxID=859144 RepID=UPI003464B47C
MNEYELQVYDEIVEWKRGLLKRSSLISRLSKKAQTRVNSLIPEKAHEVITSSIKQMVKATLTGSDFTTKRSQSTGLSLKERDAVFAEKMTFYRRTATVEGAGTGAGGILLGLADFPLLLSIKMKLLFEAASIYGYDTSKYEERLFILHIFQLAFSSDEKRRQVLPIIENWDQYKEELQDMDWREFQQEYRDHIDFIKMLQLVPGVGAAIGAYANYNLLDALGVTAKNAYRLRLIKSVPPVQ